MLNVRPMLFSAVWLVLSATGNGISWAQPRDLKAEFQVDELSDRLKISLSGQPIAEFVYRDNKILRPYFAQVKTRSGVQVTRNHPPQVGIDASDHETMHPGLWYGFGDVSGHDFWRNQGTIRHLRFTETPQQTDGKLSFATLSELLSAEQASVCQLESRIVIEPLAVDSWLLIWEATFKAGASEFSFGDQEEMGFGARVATALTEKNGGLITSSSGLKSAKATWGQPAAWCDYSGTIGDRRVGISLLTSPDNFRESWWHNRDYGVFVANPFGRAAMKQGESSRISVASGASLRLAFGACIHGGSELPVAAAFERFCSELKLLHQPPP